MDKDKKGSSLTELNKIVSLCKRRGFIFPGSDIYGGLANTFDYGPLGTELLRNIKNLWWQRFVNQRKDIYGLDGGILMNQGVWEASGHTKNFIDTLVDCKKCRKRFRLDQLPKGFKRCLDCGGELTKARKFNPMFKTFVGPVEDQAAIVYLRPETAQAIFINFNNVLDTFRPKLPFGIAQIGKAFRNEITLGRFIFRTLEFEQMEIEYFIREKDWETCFEEWKKELWQWALSLGIKAEHLRWRVHGKGELSHYSKRTEDLEFSFEGKFEELYGLAYRTDFDLKNHAKASGVDLQYQDPLTGEKFFPHVVEPSLGLNRTLLAVLFDAYTEGERTILKLRPQLAPYKVAVFPLLANKPELVQKAEQVFKILQKKFSVAWDERGNIGKRYYAQDEIGTPWCVTIDFTTLEDETVTIRDRDTVEQKRVKIEALENHLTKLLEF